MDVVYIIENLQEALRASAAGEKPLEDSIEVIVSDLKQGLDNEELAWEHEADGDWAEDGGSEFEDPDSAEAWFSEIYKDSDGDCDGHDQRERDWLDPVW